MFCSVLWALLSWLLKVAAYLYGVARGGRLLEDRTGYGLAMCVSAVLLLN